MEIKIDKVDGYELSSFIKKLLPIDKFIFIKIGKNRTVSSVYFPERDAVKLVTVNSKDVFDAQVDSPIKVIFYNGHKVIDALSHFNGDIEGSIKYNEYEGELMASDLILKNEDLEITISCADPSLSFMEMSKDEMSRAFAPDGKLFEFDLLTTHVDRMKSLFNLDKDEEVFTLSTSDKGVNVNGLSFNTTITHTFESDIPKSEVVIYKKYLNLLDKENYKVIVCENKVVFKSLDTDTHLTIAVAITDEEQ